MIGNHIKKIKEKCGQHNVAEPVMEYTRYGFKLEGKGSYDEKILQLTTESDTVRLATLSFRYYGKNYDVEVGDSLKHRSASKEMYKNLKKNLSKSKDWIRVSEKSNKDEKYERSLTTRNIYQKILAESHWEESEKVERENERDESDIYT